MFTMLQALLRVLAVHEHWFSIPYIVRTRQHIDVSPGTPWRSLLRFRAHPPKWPPASVHLFSPGDDCATVAASIFKTNGGVPENGQFVSSRHALLFKPGTYSCAVLVGYYTQVRGGLE